MSTQSILAEFNRKMDSNKLDMQPLHDLIVNNPRAKERIEMKEIEKRVNKELRKD